MERKTLPGANPPTVNKDLCLISALYRWAIRAGHVEENPARKVERLSEKGRARETYLTGADARAFVEACPPALHPLVVTALNTGCRRGELLALAWRDVDLERREIVISAQNEKTGRGRVIPKTTALHGLLEALRSRRPPPALDGSDRVFLGPDGSPLKVGFLRGLWEQAIEAVARDRHRRGRRRPAGAGGPLEPPRRRSPGGVPAGRQTAPRWSPRRACRRQRTSGYRGRQPGATDARADHRTRPAPPPPGRPARSDRRPPSEGDGDERPRESGGRTDASVARPGHSPRVLRDPPWPSTRTTSPSSGRARAPWNPARPRWSPAHQRESAGHWHSAPLTEPLMVRSMQVDRGRGYDDGSAWGVVRVPTLECAAAGPVIRPPLRA